MATLFPPSGQQIIISDGRPTPVMALWMQQVSQELGIVIPVPVPGPPSIIVIDEGGGGGGGDGEQGPPGPVGLTGATGATGPEGAAGIPAQDGADGEDALMIPGNQGPQGNDGATGPAGPIGIGLDGDQGDDGMAIPGPVGPSGAAGGLVLLDSQSAASSASIEFTALSSTYATYCITAKNVVPQTDTANLLMTWSDSGGYFSTNYRYVQFFRGTTTAFGTTVSASAANIQVWGNVDNSVPVAGIGWLLGSQQSSGDATFEALWSGFNGSAEYFKVETSGIHGLTSALTKIKFAMSSGNITTGDFKLYGMT